jgi:hypothetical protein
VLAMAKIRSEPVKDSNTRRRVKRVFPAVVYQFGFRIVWMAYFRLVW